MCDITIIEFKPRDISRVSMYCYDFKVIRAVFIKIKDIAQLYSLLKKSA